MKVIVLLFLVVTSLNCFAQPRLPVYDQYNYLINHINAVPQQEITTFIQTHATSPLGKNLRNQWLRWLARQKNWELFLLFYAPNNNADLDCDFLTALYHLNKSEQALARVENLWLVGHSQPTACHEIFTIWQHSPQYQPYFIPQRIELALNENNLRLVRYLTTKLPLQQQHLIDIWVALYEQPRLLKQYPLGNDPLSRRILLSSLKKWASEHVHPALHFWQSIPANYPFTEAEKQEFYQQLCLSLALHNDPLTEEWFNKLAAQSYTPRLRFWRIRRAMLQGQWQQVKTLIEALPTYERQQARWIYWYARALAALQNPAGLQIFQQLSQQRDYYGFLASYQLHREPKISNKPYRITAVSLTSHTAEIDFIKYALQHQQYADAALITRHVLSELNQPQSYELAKLFAKWQWYAKSLVIANDPAYQNDLSLRFPMPYFAAIITQAARYQVAPSFIYAIMRQESYFQANIKSVAGAVGLMQLTPFTAVAVSRQLKIPFRHQDDLLQPQFNIKLGTAYLNHLNQHFAAHPILVAAAYNAGPHQTFLWQKHQATQQADIWIETLPWKETRNYLKHIITFDTIYRQRLHQKTALANFMQEIKPHEKI